MRLPAFMTNMAPIGHVWRAFGQTEALVKDAVAGKNAQLAVSTAEEGLSNWERDYGLPSDGDTAARRSRILTARTGQQTLTVERLRELALTVGGADRGEVVEKFARCRVTLCALFDGREPGDLTALEETVARLKPAHLDVRVRSSLPPAEVIYHGPATPLSSGRSNPGAAPAGDYALFAGGSLGATSNIAAVDAYDAALTRTLPAALSAARAGTAGVGNHGYAVFGGGLNAAGTAYLDTVDAYSPELTRSTLAKLSYVQDPGIRGGNVGRYALIGLGWYNSIAGPVKTVDAYSDTLTKSTAPDASEFHWQCGAAQVGGFLLFAGGSTQSTTTGVVDVYGEDLTRTTAPSLSYTNTSNIKGGSVGRYALFLGGAGSAVVNAYDEDLTRSIPEALSVARQRGGVTTVQGCLIYALGIGSDGEALGTVEVYDEELTHTTGLACSYAAGHPGACTVGNFALFAGGYQDSARFGNVDAFTID